MCSQEVHNITSNVSHMLWQTLLSFHLYGWGKKKELHFSKLTKNDEIKLKFLNEKVLGRAILEINGSIVIFYVKFMIHKSNFVSELFYFNL